MHSSPRPDNQHYIREQKEKSVCGSFRTFIGVAPIMQLRTCVIQIVTFKGGHLRWLKRFSISLGTTLKGKNSLPLGANTFLKEKFSV